MSDDIVDSWEDLEDNGELDKQLKNLVPTNSNSEESQKESDGVTPAAQKLHEDNGGRTPYKPSVRILKREPNATGQNNPVLSARATQSKPIRTLEEREAAYAEARLRILGSAESPQESNLSNGEATSSNSQGSVAVGKPSTDGASSSSVGRPTDGASSSSVGRPTDGASSSSALAKGPTKDASNSGSR